jgi:hypothetical protein
MLETLPELQGIESPEEMRAKFGDFLGLEGPAPRAVFRRALVDDHYARYLITSRHRPSLLAVLFKDPRNRQYEEPEAATERSSLELVVKAGGAMVQWSRTGFARVAAETFERRFAACQACEHLVAPPDKLVYKIRFAKASDPRVCNACGCVASRKAHLPTERCPVASADDPALNRWGEPR